MKIALRRSTQWLSQPWGSRSPPCHFAGALHSSPQKLELSRFRLERAVMAHNLAALLAADLVGYDSLKADDHDAAGQMLSDFGEVVSDHIDRHLGCPLNTAPEALFLASFSSAVEAVGCAVELQRDLAERSRTAPATRQMQCRIGVNHHDSLPGGEASTRDEGTSVARLVALADPGGVCISRTVYDEVRFQLRLPYDTERDPSHTAFTCGEIRKKRNELNLLEASVVRIGPATLPGEARNVAGSRIRFKDARDLIHKITAVFNR